MSERALCSRRATTAPAPRGAARAENRESAASVGRRPLVIGGVMSERALCSRGATTAPAPRGAARAENSGVESRRNERGSRSGA